MTLSELYFEVIGRAAKRLDDAHRAAHPEIPWRALALPAPWTRQAGGLRDVLIHQYEGVDIKQVWALVKGDLPGLKGAIAALLPPLE